MAVIATLIYLAIQIRQNTNSVQGANEVQKSREQMDFVAQIIADEELRELWHKAATHQPMDTREQLRYLWLMMQWFLMCDGWYRLHQRGLISDDLWDAALTTTIGYLQHPLVTEW